MTRSSSSSPTGRPTCRRCATCRLQKQREYYAQTVAYIMPLAASRGWWALWYASWQEVHRDLA